MNNRKTRVLADLQEKKLLKVIAGINNFDKERVLKIVKSAEAMNASCVDISAREDIVTEAREFAVNTALMVSSVKVEELERAIKLGVDMVELGNFEALHDEGVFFMNESETTGACSFGELREYKVLPSAKLYTADEVLTMATEIMNIKADALVSITVPGHLSVKDQVMLAEKLEELGVDMIQTEGASLVSTDKAAALGQIEKARLTLANTMELSKVLSKTAIITASGITPDTAKLAIAAGANGVGVGKYVNKLESELEMMAAITALKESLKPVTKLTNTRLASFEKPEFTIS